MRLPIEEALPDLLSALRHRGRAVLQAPPGAGKTTMVPLAILRAGLVPGRIVMLEPRRLAARAAAERMAETLGEAVGETVGYRIRGEARTSARTRIVVVTEGILTRMIQSNAELPGISCLIFDEFHERSLNADLGLALALEVAGALRDDLMLLVMSATLDGGPVATLMGDAPLVTSEGRAYPVETHWLPRPLDASLRLEAAMAGLILQALDACPEGGVLAFLPGEGEIARLQATLGPRLPKGVEMRPLFGAMDLAAQHAALAPATPGARKLVLATAIAETSLTIPDVRVVVDAGRARRARFDPASGMSRLVTERVTRAEAEQRRGRAGRVAPGTCYRLWSKGEEGALAAFPPPEIASTDLTGLALELALWGATDLPFLTPPPPAALAEAQALLADLGALDARGTITAHGRHLAALPLHPRLAHMLLKSGTSRATAARLAALLAERDPLRGAPPDLALRMAAIADPRKVEAETPHFVHRATIERIRAEAKRLERLAPQAATGPALTLGQLAALAYPDRVGLRRKGEAPRWLLSGGKGAAMEPGLPLSEARLIVATDLDGDPREARLRQAVPLREAELRAVLGDRIEWRDVIEWSRREGRVLARRQEMLGAIALTDQHLPDPDPAALARAALEGARLLGHSWSPAAARLAARVALCRRGGADLPDVSEPALLAGEALLPYLARVRTASDLKALDLVPMIQSVLGWEGQQLLDRLTPSHFSTPLGRRVPIDYDGETPAIEVKLQELFGVTEHPTVGPDRLPLRITMLSPGGKPVQVTADLPGFWTNSYADVRRDMRGRYPRHPWPDDPREAEPTTRAKPRGT